MVRPSAHGGGVGGGDGCVGGLVGRIAYDGLSRGVLAFDRNDDNIALKAFFMRHGVKKMQVARAAL